MRRDLDLFDYLLRWTLGPLIARWHRRRIERQSALIPPEGLDREGIADWHRANPGRCMYCAYTRWANEEHGQSLKIDAHVCVEGNGPAMPLPEARVRQ